MALNFVLTCLYTKAGSFHVLITFHGKTFELIVQKSANSVRQGTAV